MLHSPACGVQHNLQAANFIPDGACERRRPAADRRGVVAVVVTEDLQHEIH
jgi:hypothetical protein